MLRLLAREKFRPRRLAIDRAMLCLLPLESGSRYRNESLTLVNLLGAPKASNNTSRRLRSLWRRKVIRDRSKSARHFDRVFALQSGVARLRILAPILALTLDTPGLLAP